MKENLSALLHTGRQSGGAGEAGDTAAVVEQPGDADCTGDLQCEFFYIPKIIRSVRDSLSRTEATLDAPWALAGRGSSDVSSKVARRVHTYPV